MIITDDYSLILFKVTRESAWHLKYILKFSEDCSGQVFTIKQQPQIFHNSVRVPRQGTKKLTMTLLDLV
jgi:hypothetical protein